MSQRPKPIVIDARIRRSSTGRYVDRLLEHLQKFDVQNQYTILLAPDDDWRPINQNFEVTFCKYQQFSFNPLEQIGFAWQLYKLKPGLVHFAMTQQPVLYFGKIVTTTHDLTMLNYTKTGKLPMWVHKFRMFLYRFLLWQSHRKSVKVIVPTNYVKRALLKHHPFVSNKIKVTLEASEPPVKEPPKKPADAPDNFILYVGTAFPHKNLNRLIEVFQTIRSKNPSLNLVLAGKREYHSLQLEKWAKESNSAKNISFIGFVSDPELKWLYKNAKCYVFPSLSEGFGLPGLEAMAHGCPVVSSNSTCLPEVYGDAAEYFDPEDTNEMAKSIEKVLSDKELRASLIKKGQTQVQKYSWQKMAEETLAVYNGVLKKTP